MNWRQVDQAWEKRYDRDTSLLARRLVEAKSELDRIYGLLKDVPEARLFLTEFAWIHQASDPGRGQSLDSNSRSADPPAEGDATIWAREAMRRAKRKASESTAELQSWMGTPPSERLLVTPNGKCIACRRPWPKRTKVRVSRDGVEE